MCVCVTLWGGDTSIQAFPIFTPRSDGGDDGRGSDDHVNASTGRSGGCRLGLAQGGWWSDRRGTCWAAAPALPSHPFVARCGPHPGLLWR